jgi:hypothetical protein
LMLVALRPEPVAEAQELRLIDRRQDCHHRCLDDLVLYCGDAERPLSAIRLRNIGPARWQRSIRSRLDARVEVREVLLETFHVFGPRHLVDATRSSKKASEQSGLGCGGARGALQPPAFPTTSRPRLAGPAMEDSPRITRGRCGSLLLHRDGLPPSASCRSPGAPVHSIRSDYLHTETLEELTRSHSLRCVVLLSGGRSLLCWDWPP